MGHSRAQKAESHDRIVRIAAERFRELGVDGIGLVDLMKEAGMTHGGFYKHFASREDLVAESVERALIDGGKGAFRAEAESRLGKQELLFALVDWYLSAGHRDSLATSCAVASLAGDVARCSERTRTAYTQQVDAYLNLFIRLMPGDESRARKREKALAAWAGMVGGVSMARAVSDGTLSLDILQSTATSVKAQLLA